MEFKKPELTEKQKERANDVYRYLKTYGVSTKQELCNFLDWKYNSSNDRRIREILSILAKKVPIISLSNQKGYKLATIKDMDDVIHQWKEFDSRIKEMEARRKPLIDFYSKYYK